MRVPCDLPTKAVAPAVFGICDLKSEAGRHTGTLVSLIVWGMHICWGIFKQFVLDASMGCR